jgi:group II intron reverse transcriptase/maturase
MRNADTTLAIIQERGKRGLDLEDVYRQLYNPDLYLRAYGRIYKNAGAMTEGVTEETVDGMSQQKIEKIIESLRMERYRWSPTRRTYIPKKNGKLRPLGIPTWSDKLLQEVVRSILEAYYEPQFSERSHGFRPDRGCHTALREIFVSWNGTKWLIEGDIKGCFDNIDHTVLLSILREKIHDNRFLILVSNLLKAGYLEQWDQRPTYSGTPQGGIVSPLLANIYLDRLDKYVETTLIPEFNRGKVKQANPEYRKLARKIQTLTEKGATATAIASLRKEIRDHPSKDQFDPNYRRLRYIRYADDFLLGLDGPRDEAEIIKGRIGEFLRDHLKLELSPDKTLITHAMTEKARFLGYDITAARTNVRRRGVSGQMVLLVPPEVIEAKVSRYTQDGEPVSRLELCHDSDFSIVTRYGAEYRGIVQYYAYARNRFWLNRLHGVMWKSLFKTLGRKHKTTTRKLIGKFASRRVNETGRIVKCVTVIIEREGKTPLVALFGGISLTPSPMTKIQDVLQDRDRIYIGHNEIMQRLLADTCELCGSRENIQVHHIRKLKDLQKPGRRPRPYYVQVMASRRRKTLVVCQACHNAIHAGKPIVEGRSNG